MKRKLPLFVVLFALFGCRGLNFVPSWDRSGAYYELTRDYTSRPDFEGKDFCGLGKAMVQGGWTGGQMAMVALPLPTLYLGYPLMWAERVTLCPLVDTLMLPRDLYVRHAHRAEERDARTVFELRDSWDRPVAGERISVRASPRDMRVGLFYDGVRTNILYATVRTDADGRAILPLATPTCGTLRTSASYWTADGGYWESHLNLDGTNLEPATAKTLVMKTAPRSNRKQNPDAPIVQAPDSFVCNFSAEARRRHMSMWGNTPEESLRDRYFEAAPVTRPDDFDAYWDGERARLDREVPFAAQVDPLPGHDTAERTAYAVSFPSFGRTVRGFLSVPRGTGRHPVRIRVATEGAEFPAPPAVGADEMLLALNVFSPESPSAADCSRRYGDSLTRSYALDGLETSREAYFFHPFILGAARGVAWFLDRPDADPAQSTVEGVSQGAGLGLWLMAFEPRLSAGCFVQPGHVNNSDERYQSCVWPKLARGTPHETARYLARSRPHRPYFDTLCFAERVRGTVTLHVLHDGDERDMVRLFRALPENTRPKLTLWPYDTHRDGILPALTTAK